MSADERAHGGQDGRAHRTGQPGPGPVGHAIGAAPAPPAGPVAAPPEPAAEDVPADRTAAASPAPVPALRQPAAALAVPPAPGGPGPVTGAGDAAVRDRPDWRARGHGRLPRLHAGMHVATAGALDRLQLTNLTVGLLLGRSQDGGTVAVTLFRPEPVRVALVGGAWAVKLLTFRALGFGARVVVFTHDARGWIDLGARAIGRTDRVTVLAPGSTAIMKASADAPLLHLTGADMSTQERTSTKELTSTQEPTVTREAVPAGETLPDVAELPAWTTRLSVRHQLSADQAAAVAEADIVLTQRLAPPEAATLAAVRGLTQRTSYTLQALRDDMLAVLTRDGCRYAWVNPTPLEQDALGPPSRFSS